MSNPNVSNHSVSDPNASIGIFQMKYWGNKFGLNYSTWRDWRLNGYLGERLTRTYERGLPIYMNRVELLRFAVLADAVKRLGNANGWTSARLGPRIPEITADTEILITELGDINVREIARDLLEEIRADIRQYEAEAA